MPAIAYTLERRPADTRGKAFIALDDMADKQAFPRPPGIDVEWLSSEGFLDDAVSGADWPSGGKVITWAGAKTVAAPLPRTRSGAAGVPPRAYRTALVREGVHHGFMQMSHRLAEARDAIGQAAGFFAETTGPA